MVVLFFPKNIVVWGAVIFREDGQSRGTAKPLRSLGAYIIP